MKEHAKIKIPVTHSAVAATKEIVAEVRSEAIHLKAEALHRRFLGAPDARNYTLEADVMSDGNRRKMSEVGLINQRYAVVLKGNDQKIEVNSNLERLRQSVDFKWQPNVWYHLKSRVDIAADGAGVVRAKAWKKGEPEPEAWTIEVPHKTAHVQGSPGLFGFSPQDMRVYIDNVSVSAN